MFCFHFYIEICLQKEKETLKYLRNKGEVDLIQVGVNEQERGSVMHAFNNGLSSVISHKQYSHTFTENFF